MISGYKDEIVLLNVSFEFLFGPRRGKFACDPRCGECCTNPTCSRCINSTRMTCRRTGDKETKAHPTIHMPINNVNQGLPKSKCPKGLCVMLNTHGVTVTNSKVNKEDDAEYSIWQRSSRSSPRWVTPTTWRRGAVDTYHNQG